MEHPDTPIRDLIAQWPEPAKRHVMAVRAILQEVAKTAQTGPLDENLKWGQPSWRPRRPRTGATLRLNWSDAAPDRLMAYVDCKTDLASQMSSRFPGQFYNDGRRAMGFDLYEALPTDAIAQLAHMTFTYHRRKT